MTHQFNLSPKVEAAIESNVQEITFSYTRQKYSES